MKTNFADTKAALKLIVQDMADTLFREIDEVGTEEDLLELVQRTSKLPTLLTKTWVKAKTQLELPLACKLPDRGNLPAAGD